MKNKKGYDFSLNKEQLDKIFNTTEAVEYSKKKNSKTKRNII